MPRLRSHSELPLYGRQPHLAGAAAGRTFHHTNKHDFRYLAPRPIRRRIMPEHCMGTLGLILSLLAIFGVCLLWATHGHPSNADNEDLGVVSKDH